MQTSSVIQFQDVTKRFGAFTAVESLNLDIKQGEFFSLLGPSGCGKTTTLRMVAGFETPTEGEIYLNDDAVGKLPPFKRDVNTVFQNYALFPHLTVEENVAFGLEMKNVDKSEISQRVDESLSLVRLPGMNNRKPSQLSGGQRQRVALARALVNRPQVLLLDEPLGALDAKLRKEMQLELKDLQRQLGITFIFVTHDQEEALVMSDRIGVMQTGHLLQVGSPQEIYEAPNSQFVADFIGETNFVACKVIANKADCAEVSVGNDVRIEATTAEPMEPGTEATLTIRPEKILVHTNEDVPAGRVQFDALVKQVVFMGTDTLLTIEISKDVHLEALHQNTTTDAKSFQEGQNVTISWKVESGRVLAY